MSALLEALFASLLKDENKNLRKKKEKAAAATLRSKSEIETREDDVIKVEDDEEEEIIKVNDKGKCNMRIFKVNMEHSRINRGRKSLEQAVNLQKLPVIQVMTRMMTMTMAMMMVMTMIMTMTMTMTMIMTMAVQEELSVGKKLNTNGDKDDQSGGAVGPAASTVRGSINSDLRDSMSSIQGPIIKSLDLGSTDSSWIDAAGTMTDSGEEEEVNQCNCRKRQL